MDNLDLVLVAPDASLRSEDSVRRRVEALRANFAELRELAANDPELLAQGKAMLAMLHGKSLPAGLLRRLVQAAWEQPTGDLRGLSGRSRGTAIHRAVVQLYRNADRAAEESGAMQALDGADELAVCRDFVVRRIFSTLRPADVQGLHAALHSQNGARLSRAYGGIASLAGGELSEGLRAALYASGQTLRLTMIEANRSLCDHLGREYEPIEDLAGDPPRPETFGAAGLVDEVLVIARNRLAVQTKEAVDHYAKGGGPAAERLRRAFTDRLGPEPRDPQSRLFDASQRATRMMILRPMLNALRRIASVKNGIPALDPNRTFPIRLDGEELPIDTLAALDHYARFVTKGRKTRFDSLTPAERNKANFATLIATKGMGSILASSFGILLDPRNNDPKVRFEGDVAEQGFDLSLDAAGNLSIVYTYRQIPTAAVFGNERIPCGQGSEVKGKLEILVNADDLERFANQDFTKYDDRPAGQILAQKPDDKYTRAYFAVPEPFRLRLTTLPVCVADLK